MISKVDHHTTKKMTTLNLKKGERESEQNHVFSEGKSKQKPIRLSVEGIKNML